MKTLRQPAPRDVPLWSLWLVALVCFGPLILIWLLGLLVTPFWVALLFWQQVEPERFASAEPMFWELVWPIGVVVAGFVGIVGLVRLLTISRRERPRRHRVFTLGLVAVGLIGLAIFDFPFLGSLGDASDLADAGALVWALALYVLLPFGGAAWLLAKSWRFLIAPRPSGRGDTCGGRS